MTKLDEAYQKWLALQPMGQHEKYRLSQRFAIDFNYNSNHVEGNTLTYGQTELLLLFGKVMGEADIKDCDDMKASAVCLKIMETEALEQDRPLSQNFIRELHKTLIREDYTVHRKLPGGDYFSFVVHAGQYKTRPNSVITRTGERFEYASPEETPSLMADLVDWYNEEERKGDMHPVELAALFHYRYIRIHPFGDGNGRIARLLVNYILSRHNYPMIVVRSRKKDEYLAALSAADKAVGPEPSRGAKATLKGAQRFITYFKKLVASEIEMNIKFVTIHDETVWWYDGEMIIFRSESTSKILNAIMLDPGITAKRLSEIAGINEAAVNKHLKRLTDNHYIQRRQDGTFYVFITPSIM